MVKKLAQGSSLENEGNRGCVCQLNISSANVPYSASAASVGFFPSKKKVRDDVVQRMSAVTLVGERAVIAWCVKLWSCCRC